MIFDGLGVHWYGFWIALGVLLWFVLAIRDAQVRRFLTTDDLVRLLNWSIVAGLVGGRLLHVFINWSSYDSWSQIFAFWQGGLSILGAMMGIGLVFFVFAFIYRVSALFLLDALLSYAPLAQAFGRVGCFSAGCCYGCSTCSSIGVCTCIDGMCRVVHPVQLYNVVLLALLFVFVQGVRYLSLPRGMVSLVSVVGLLTVRFVTDFWRGDREWSVVLPWFSIHQWVSLAGIVILLLGYLLYRVLVRRGGWYE